MDRELLGRTVTAFNGRRYEEAAALVDGVLCSAVGRDELFWLGMRETCEGFALVMSRDLAGAEPRLIGAMEKLRNFGYRHNNLDVTGVLAGLRRGLEEVQNVRGRRKCLFDVSLLPKLKMSAEADTR